jgi:bacterioferritin-associated ferredoxin
VFVCICEAVTEDEVELAVLAGADTVEAVTAATEAGSCCGTCHPAIEAVLERTCPLRTGAMAERRCPRIDALTSAIPERRRGGVDLIERTSPSMRA